MPPVFTNWKDLTKQVRRIGWLLLGFTGAQVLAGWILRSIYARYYVYINEETYAGIRLFLLTLLTTGGTALIGKKVLRVKWTKSNFQWNFSWETVSKTVASMFTITITFSMLLTLIQMALGVHFMDGSLTEYNSPLYVVLMILSAVFIAPCCEELLFRGEIEHSLMPYGALFAAIFSGILFGWMHMNFTQGIMHMFTGTFLGLVYYKHRNLSLNIVCHMLFNGITVGLNYLTNFMGLRAIIVFVLVVYGILGLKDLRPLPEKSSYPIFRMAFRQISIVLFFIVFLVISIWSIY